jgi:hypothetical protein
MFDTLQPTLPGSNTGRGPRYMRIQRGDFEDKYLGLPTPEGRMNRGKFQNLQAKLCKRILQWGDLSQGGKEVLIKAVAQALPTYIMGVFKLPFSVCDDLTRLIRNFWWGADRGKRKMHWMIKPKSDGVLVFVTCVLLINLY